jgi:hypothetical protein
MDSELVAVGPFSTVETYPRNRPTLLHRQPCTRHALQPPPNQQELQLPIEFTAASECTPSWDGHIVTARYQSAGSLADAAGGK